MITLYCQFREFISISVPAGGHASDEQLLKLPPIVSQDMLVTGNHDRLPDVGGKQSNSVHTIFFFQVYSHLALMCAYWQIKLSQPWSVLLER